MLRSRNGDLARSSARGSALDSSQEARSQSWVATTQAECVPARASTRPRSPRTRKPARSGHWRTASRVTPRQPPISAPDTNSALCTRPELFGVLEALDELVSLVREGKQPFGSSVDRRHRFRYLWIVADSRLKKLLPGDRRCVSRAVGELGQAIGFRHTLAFSLPAR